MSTLCRYSRKRRRLVRLLYMPGHFEIKKEEVMGLLKSINVPTLDGIYLRLVREARERIVGSMTNIFLTCCSSPRGLEGSPCASVPESKNKSFIKF